MEWITKLLSRLEDQSLLVLAAVVLLVVYSCFRLLSVAVKMLADAYTEQEKRKAEAIISLAEEVRRGNEICHSHTLHMAQIIRTQEMCREELLRGGGSR